jgi:hypothetical protein
MTRKEAKARLRLVRAALERIDELSGEEWTSPALVDPVRRLYEQRADRLAERVDSDRNGGSLAGGYARLRRAAIEAERQALARLGPCGEVSAGAAREIERELDLEEVRLRD